jgi:predicted transposase/invertase (TIGR01784 family)
MKRTKEQSLLLPKYDVTFKSLFKDENNSDIVEDFLKAALRLPADEHFEEILVQDSELLPKNEGEKLSILDVKLKLTGRGYVNIEIQLCFLEEMKERLLHYWSMMASSQLRAGQNYDNFKQVIGIVIADFNFIDDSDHYHQQYVLYDKEHDSQFTDLMEFVTLELPKLPKESDLSDAWAWARFFKTDSEKEMHMLAEKNEKIGKAVMVLEKLSADEQARVQAVYEEMMRRDYVSRVKSAEKRGETRGIEIGEKRGETRGKDKTIDAMEGAMKEVGISDELIESVKSLIEKS